MLARSLLVLAALVAMGLGEIRRLAVAAAWVDHTDQTIAQANLALRLMIDKETGVRAFLLTREHLFLEVYEQARPTVALDALSRLVADNPPQAARVRALRERYLQWLQTAEDALANPADGGRTSALVSRKRDMDAIRDVVASFAAEEEAVRADRVRAVTRETFAAQVGGVAILILAGGAVIWMFRRELSLAVGLYEDAFSRAVASEASEHAARRRAEDALQAKEEFLWTLSHELRTPLTTVLGCTGVLRRGKPTAERLDRALSMIERGARAEVRIVDDLLDASRIATGKLEIASEPTTLDEAVSAAVESCREAAAEKDLIVDLVHAPSPLVVRGDAERLQQVTRTLVSNAIKFSHRGGRVEVRLDNAGDRAVLRVRDEGAGIPAEFLPHVFERFRQRDVGLKRAHAGLGLGLSIAKHLVERHGGIIEVESAGSGRGATFTVSIPISAGDAVPAPLRVPSEAEPLRGVHVLVVDDDSDALRLVTDLLREHGAVVSASARAADALDVIARGRVDILVADIGLPDFDGYELLQRARASGGAIPALALTARAGIEDRKRAHLVGYDRHVTKPFSPENLVTELADLAHEKSGA